MPVTNRVRAEHTRTFTGCRTCRRRHAKCDEERPKCGACSRLGLKCGGYSAQLSWVTDEDDADSNGQQALCYRYPLFSGMYGHLDSNEVVA
jgi:arginine metabolism regulation protein II